MYILVLQMNRLREILNCHIIVNIVFICEESCLSRFKTCLPVTHSTLALGRLRVQVSPRCSHPLVYVLSSDSLNRFKISFMWLSSIESYSNNEINKLSVKRPPPLNFHLYCLFWYQGKIHRQILPLDEYESNTQNK